MRPIMIFGCGLALCQTACGQPAPSALAPAPCDEPVMEGSPLGVRCGQLVDEDGRVVFLRGVNARVDGLFDVTFDDGRAALESVPTFGAEDAAIMRDFGFDALRLPVNWSGIEPSRTGGFDAQYLQRLRDVLDLAAEANLLVLVDFHQDAYSKEIGEDGAPLWAIQPEPEELLEGPLLDLEERRLSGQVVRAFETFFGEGEVSTRLRERYVAMATRVATELADHPAVIGFEIFNEPVADDDGIERVNAIAYPSLRAAAPGKLYVFEPPAIRNFTDEATLPAGPLGVMTGYAPHIYTFAFASGETAATIDEESLRRSNENARQEADAWAAPLLITEWGFSPHAASATSYLRAQSALQQQYQASSFFWLWKESSQGSWGCFDYEGDAWVPRDSVRDALATVRPERVAGWPERFAFDHDTGVFEMRFWSTVDVATPHWIGIAPALESTPHAACDDVEVPIDPRDTGRFEVRCGEGDGASHVLRVWLGAG